MAICDVCGNDYDKAFEVTAGAQHYTFDSFECAIQALAPTCLHCSCRIIGHGIEVDGDFFCCANCARRSGETKARDRIKTEGDDATAASTTEEDIVAGDYILRGTP